MPGKTKRALWLINHTTLRKFEVPLLMELGYEVYLPKSFPYDEGNLSASIDFTYDKTLTIPPEALAVLNRTDLYTGWPDEVADIANRYFDVCIFSFFPEQMRGIMRKYTGTMVFRPFGLDNNTHYAAVLMQIFGVDFFTEYEQIKERFYFGQAYENLCEVEPQLFQSRTVTLPVGIADAQVKDRWQGKKDRILFICPRIETSPYYNRHYKSFVEHFGRYDYIIGGAQPITPADPKVAGFLPDAEYKDMYLNSRLMFYHSSEKRHIHYHPFEAVKCGLPLVFMAGGMLDTLGGRELPGRCKNIAEAKAKIRRMMRGDTRLIASIRESQGVLLEKVAYDHCKKQWVDGFKQIEEENGLKGGVKPKKIAVVLGEGYTGGVLDYTFRLISALKWGIDENKDAAKVVFAHCNHQNFRDKNHFERIEEMGIEIRPFDWKKKTGDLVRDIIALKFGEDLCSDQYNQPFYYTPDDAIAGFSDCDYLIFTVDRAPGFVFTLQPYAVCVHDFIQRYLPEMFGGYYEENILEFSRSADTVIVNTPASYDDVVQYVGIPKKKVKPIPWLFDAVDAVNDENVDSSKDSGNDRNKNKDKNKNDLYFLWSTNIAAHKNHKVVLEGLAEYYQRGGKLRCIVTGVNTEKFDVKRRAPEEPYVNLIREIIAKDDNLKKKVIFKGNLPKNVYIQLLQNAKFLLHGGLVDNGNLSIMDAALLGVPSISSRYHAMENMEAYLKLGLRFFDPHKPKALAALLLKTQEDYVAFQKSLPPRDALLKYTIEHTYRDVYKVFKEIIQF